MTPWEVRDLNRKMARLLRPPMTLGELILASVLLIAVIVAIGCGLYWLWTSALALALKIGISAAAIVVIGARIAANLD